MTLAVNSTLSHRDNVVRQVMELCISHEFRFVLKIILVLYNVVLAHSAITRHPVPFSSGVVMAGLITAEISLISLILQITMAKVDSKVQQYVTIISIFTIAIAVGVNAIGGVSVIQEVEPLRFIAAYTKFVSPLLPIVVLLLVFLSDSSSDFVQRTIRQAVSSAEIESATQKSNLLIAKSEQTARLRKQQLANQLVISDQIAQNEIAELELLRGLSVREKEAAQINAMITIARNEALVMVEVATRAIETRKEEMFLYLESDDFVKTIRSNSKRDALNLIKLATAVTSGSANTPTDFTQGK